MPRISIISHSVGRGSFPDIGSQIFHNQLSHISIIAPPPSSEVITRWRREFFPSTNVNWTKIVLIFCYLNKLYICILYQPYIRTELHAVAQYRYGIARIYFNIHWLIVKIFLLYLCIHDSRLPHWPLNNNTKYKK